MIIKLVSYPSWNRLSSKQRKLRISTVVEILNKKDVDFVMFSEWVFNNIEDLNSVCQLVHNEKVTALFELKLSRGLVGNQLFLLQNGKVIDLKTHQVFSEHKDATEENIERLLDELECHRQFIVGEKRFLVIQCGENNVLKTQRGVKNRAEFRLENSNLKKRFDKVIDSVDVILNPVHTKWGRFYDFTCRLYKFSEKKRCCFYCSQLEGNQLINAINSPEKNTAQRAMKNRKLLSPHFCSDINNKEFLLQTYEI